MIICEVEVLKLGIKYHFDAAHLLTFHEGKCRNLHGHRWDVEVLISGEVFNRNILIDFKKVKDVIDEFDHKTLLCLNSRNEDLIICLQKCKLEMVALECEPTAENLVKLIQKKIKRIAYGCNIRVKLYESPDCFAEWGDVIED